jgi:polar amino acid transport system ATP-binding protein
MSAAPLIEVRGVTKAFGEAQVLRGIDLAVREHEAVALIGASGSGKSTLLRCIDLLDPIDDGDVLLDGEVVTDPSVDPVAIRRRLGMVFQAFNLFPHLRVIDNITLARRRVHNVGRAQAQDEAMAMLDRVGLRDKARARPDDLSGGQQQRVAIARALVNRPQLMLFDEVTSALDPELVGEVLALIRELKEDGMTMVLATHEMSFAREVSDRVCFLDGGMVLEAGAPDQVFSEPREPRTRQFLRRIVEAGRM